MTAATSPATPPPAAVAEAMVRELHELGVLWPAVERLVVSGSSDGLPSWVRARVLDPWQPISNGRAWGRYRTTVPQEHRGGAPTEAYVWLAHGRWWRYRDDTAQPDEFSTPTEAMEAEDVRVREQGWLHDDVRPPEEEAPAAEPTPAPEPLRTGTTADAGDPAGWAVSRGSGRRAGQHRWSRTSDGLDRCTECERWRHRGQYWRASATEAEALTVLERRAGDHVPGRCPGRRT